MSFFGRGRILLKFHLSEYKKKRELFKSLFDNSVRTLL